MRLEKTNLKTVILSSLLFIGGALFGQESVRLKVQDAKTKYRGTGNEAPETFKELAVSYFKAGGQIIFTKWAWQPYLGLAQTLWGQNVFKATAYSGGVIKKF